MKKKSKSTVTRPVKKNTKPKQPTELSKDFIALKLLLSSVYQWF